MFLDASQYLDGSKHLGQFLTPWEENLPPGFFPAQHAGSNGNGIYDFESGLQHRDVRLYYRHDESDAQSSREFARPALPEQAPDNTTIPQPRAERFAPMQEQGRIYQGLDGLTTETQAGASEHQVLLKDVNTLIDQLTIGRTEALKLPLQRLEQAWNRNHSRIEILLEREVQNKSLFGFILLAIGFRRLIAEDPELNRLALVQNLHYRLNPWQYKRVAGQELTVDQQISLLVDCLGCESRLLNLAALSSDLQKVWETDKSGVLECVRKQLASLSKASVLEVMLRFRHLLAEEPTLFGLGFVQAFQNCLEFFYGEQRTEVFPWGFAQTLDFLVRGLCVDISTSVVIDLLDQLEGFFARGQFCEATVVARLQACSLEQLSRIKTQFQLFQTPRLSNMRSLQQLWRCLDYQYAEREVHSTEPDISTQICQRDASVGCREDALKIRRNVEFVVEALTKSIGTELVPEYFESLDQAWNRNHRFVEEQIKAVVSGQTNLDRCRLEIGVDAANVRTPELTSRAFLQCLRRHLNNTNAITGLPNNGLRLPEQVAILNDALRLSAPFASVHRFLLRLESGGQWTELDLREGFYDRLKEWSRLDLNKLAIELSTQVIRQPELQEFRPFSLLLSTIEDCHRFRAETEAVSDPDLEADFLVRSLTARVPTKLVYDLFGRLEEIKSERRRKIKQAFFQRLERSTLEELDELKSILSTGRKVKAEWAEFRTATILEFCVNFWII